MLWFETCVEAVRYVLPAVGTLPRIVRGLRRRALLFVGGALSSPCVNGNEQTKKINNEELKQSKQGA